MHLLATMPGTIADGSAAVDLAQTPGDIVVLSSADTETRAAGGGAAAAARDGPGGAAAAAGADPAARPQFLGRSLHGDGRRGAAGRRPHARRQRLLALRRRAAGRNLPRARHSAGAAARRRQARPRTRRTVDDAGRGRRRLWRYLAEGGPANADNFLRYAAFADRPRDAVGRAGAIAARRSLLAGPGAAEPRRHRRRWRAPAPAKAGAASCRSSSIGHWCSPATRHRSTRWCGADRAAAAAAAGLCAEPEGRRSRGLARRAVRRGAARGDPERDRVFGARRRRRRTRSRRPTARCCRWCFPAATKRAGAPARAASRRATWR